MSKQEESKASSVVNSEAQELNFLIQRVYVKDLSFEAPNTPAVFQQQWQPEMSLEIQTTHTLLDKSVYEVVLHVTTTVHNEKQVAFLVEVKQAGIFTIEGMEGPQLDHLLGSFCPNLLFPYAREAITSEVIRASFPQLVLAPVNFDALYMQNIQAQQQAHSADKQPEELH